MKKTFKLLPILSLFFAGQLFGKTHPPVPNEEENVYGLASQPTPKPTEKVPVKSTEQLTSESKIRAATMDDLPAIMDIFDEISINFYKPLYQKHYPDFECTKNYDKFLKAAVERGESELKKLLEQGSDDTKMLVATNNDGAVVGFVWFGMEDREKRIMIIEWLCVRKAVDGQGVDTELMAKALETFEGQFDICRALLTQKGNEAEHNFYKAHGFINMGTTKDDTLDGFDMPFSATHDEYQLKK